MGAALLLGNEKFILNELGFLLRVEAGIREALAKEEERGIDVATEELQAALVYVEQAQYRVGRALKEMG